MSVPVELAELAARIDEFGPQAFLVTVNADAAPHVVSVTVAWRDDQLVVGAGNRTSANVADHPTVALLWPSGDGDYSLIVDGAATVDDGELEIRPTAAVLHRVAGADPSLPGCVAVLP